MQVTNTDHIINAKGIYKIFNGDIKALSGVSCDIERGEKVVIIGPPRHRLFKRTH